MNIRVVYFGGVFTFVVLGGTKPPYDLRNSFTAIYLACDPKTKFGKCLGCRALARCSYT